MLMGVCFMNRVVCLDECVDILLAWIWWFVDEWVDDEWPLRLARPQVFPVLAAVGAELERSHARAFVGVARQTGAAPAGAHLPSDKAAACALAAVARHLYKRDITWAKCCNEC
ncbi:uncharacterized protein GBIM_14242 [Gryllus bimaculatus]|nr:uncharacterized protein GBIM_14242 [Gryllus bimaculatus]